MEKVCFLLSTWLCGTVQWTCGVETVENMLDSIIRLAQGIQEVVGRMSVCNQLDSFGVWRQTKVICCWFVSKLYGAKRWLLHKGLYVCINFTFPTLCRYGIGFFSCTCLFAGSKVECGGRIFVQILLWPSICVPCLINPLFFNKPEWKSCKSIEAITQ